MKFLGRRRWLQFGLRGVLLLTAAVAIFLGGYRAGHHRGYQNGYANRPSDFDSLIDLITKTVRPTTWEEVGGPSAIEPFGGCCFCPTIDVVDSDKPFVECAVGPWIPEDDKGVGDPFGAAAAGENPFGDPEDPFPATPILDDPFADPWGRIPLRPPLADSESP